MILGIALFPLLTAIPLLAADVVPKPIEPAELQRTLEQGGAIPVLVNTMSYLECWDHSIPGSICLPCEEFSQKAPNLFPDKGTPFVFYCESDQCYRSCEAATEALRMGYSRVSILRGGTPAWKSAGFSTISRERIPRVPVESVKPEVLDRWLQEKREVLILDIRREAAFAKGHLPGALNIPFYRLHERYPEIPLDSRVLVVDDRGFRSFLAASYLVRKGVGDVKRLFGGMAKWQAFSVREKGKR
jgi:rhodanese-related sulfurtransferase